MDSSRPNEQGPAEVTKPAEAAKQVNTTNPREAGQV
jgi:hypothetical protein